MIYVSDTQMKVSMADLVDDTCRQTPNNVLCVETLRADPGSTGADVRGLAIIIMDKINEKGLATVEQINNLLASTIDPKRMDALRSCLRYYNNGVLGLDVMGAKQALEKGNPILATQLMNDAAGNARNCEDRVSTFEGGSPLTSSNTIVNELSFIAAAIARLVK